MAHEFDFSDTSDEELCDLSEWAAESYYDIKSQHEAECAAFGDSWPGAAIQVQESWEWMQAVAAECRRRFPVAMDPVGASAYGLIGNDDIPF